MSRKHVEISHAMYLEMEEYRKYKEFPTKVILQLFFEDGVKRDKGYQEWRKRQKATGAASSEIQPSNAKLHAAAKAKQPEPEVEPVVAPKPVKPKAEEPPPPRSTGYNSDTLK